MFTMHFKLSVPATESRDVLHRLGLELPDWAYGSVIQKRIVAESGGRSGLAIIHFAIAPEGPKAASQLIAAYELVAKIQAGRPYMELVAGRRHPTYVERICFYASDDHRGIAYSKGRRRSARFTGDIENDEEHISLAEALARLAKYRELEVGRLLTLVNDTLAESGQLSLFVTAGKGNTVGDILRAIRKIIG